MEEAYIRARNLTKTYRSGTSELVVLSKIDLDIPRGEMLALVGESGAGKSTLLHLLGGLDSPSEGTIYRGRKEISGLARSANVGSVVVWNRTDCCTPSRLSDFWIFVSNTPFLSTDTPSNLQGRAGTWSNHQTTTPSPSTAAFETRRCSQCSH